MKIQYLYLLRAINCKSFLNSLCFLPPMSIKGFPSLPSELDEYFSKTNNNTIHNNVFQNPDSRPELSLIIKHTSQMLNITYIFLNSFLEKY